MAKYELVTRGPLQILGVEGTIEGGTVIGSIETDCDIAALSSALHWGTVQAKSESADEDASDEAAAAKPSRSTKRKAAAPAPAAAAAPAGDGAKGNVPSRRRR